MKRNSMTHTTLRTIWCHDNNRPQAIHGTYQVADSRCRDAVVVGNQNQGYIHGCKLSRELLQNEAQDLYFSTHLSTKL